MPAYDVALFTTMPAGDGTGYAEVFGGGYGRQTANFSGSTNDSNVDFGRAGTAWGTIKGFGLFTGAALMMWGLLTADKVVQVGYLYRFATGVISIAGAGALLFDAALFDQVLFGQAEALQLPAAPLTEVGAPAPVGAAVRVMNWSRRT